MVERKEKIELDHARCMLYAKELPKELWAEAINTTAYTLNRIPATREDKTSYEKWFGRKLSVKHLRVFGTTCYTLISISQLRKKWEPKSRKGKLVGYTDTDKNFRIWDEERRRVDIICRDVKFDDTSELSNKTSISLDMPSEKNQPHCSGSLIEKPTSVNQQEEKEKEYSNADDGENEEIQRKVGRPVCSKNKIYEKDERELRDPSKLNAPKRYDEHCCFIKSASIDYTEAVE